MVRGAKVATWLRRFCHSVLLITVRRACGSLLGLWAANLPAGCPAQTTLCLLAEVDEDLAHHRQLHRPYAISVTVQRGLVPYSRPDGISA